jgi:uncharacterized protein
MKNLTLLIKPVSSQCNLKCEYCFYHDVAQNRKVQNFGMMDEDTLETIIKKAYKYADNQVYIGFQGGEPMLRGLGFYKKLINFVEKYNVEKISTQFSLQTNGNLIDEEWASFFLKNNFLVGLSIDGYQDIHDLYRVDAKGNGTHKYALGASRILSKYDVKFNILCVVTKHTARHTKKVYNYFKGKGFRYLQFIPCLDRIGGENGKERFSLSSDAYGEFLVMLFRNWYSDLASGNQISIRMFDNIVNLLHGHQPEACDMRGTCSRGTIIEADGSVYPCDFYVLDDWYLGNVKKMDFRQIIISDKMDTFIDQSVQIESECYACEFYSICKGGCRRYKDDLENGILKNYYCKAYKTFYSQTLNKFKQI